MKNPQTSETMDSISKSFDAIVKLETTFLTDTKKIKEDELGQYIDEHNSRVNEIALHIDESIYKLIDLSTDDIITIENNLRLNGVFVPQRELTN